MLRFGRIPVFCWFWNKLGNKTGERERWKLKCWLYFSKLIGKCEFSSVVKRLAIIPAPTLSPPIRTHTHFILEEVHKRKFWICRTDALIQNWSLVPAQGNTRRKRELIPRSNRGNKPKCHLSIKKLTSSHVLEWIAGGARGQECYSSRSLST